MNNVWPSIACLPWTTLRAAPALRQSCRILPPRVAASRHAPSQISTALRRLCCRRDFSSSPPCTAARTRRQTQPASARRSAAASPPQRKPAASRTAGATPLRQMRVHPLVIRRIFGAEVSPQVGNAVIYELHKRRLNGSLVDVGVELSGEQFAGVTGEQAMGALKWLRKQIPVDEADTAELYAATVEAEWRADFVEKSRKSWLYKPAENTDDDKRNGRQRKKAKTEQELADDSFIAEKMKQYREHRAVKAKENEAKMAQLQEENDTKDEERRVAIVQYKMELEAKRDEKLALWDELEKKAELDVEGAQADQRSAFSRLYGPWAFGVALTVLLSVTLWTPSVVGSSPELAYESWKLPGGGDITSSAVTCAAITGINLLVMLAWRHPRAWWAMNRYFLRSSAQASSFSVLGSVFSHQKWIWHLSMNSAALFTIGMPLHDYIGRNNFLAIYISSGIISSLVSLSWHVIRGNMLFAAIGSSGALFGLAGAFFTIRPGHSLAIPGTEQIYTVPGWSGVALTLILDRIMFVVTKGASFDHLAHLGGLLAGAGWGYALWSASKEDATGSRVGSSTLATAVDGSKPVEEAAQ